MRIPNVRQALRGLGRPASFQIIKTEVKDHEATPSVVATTYINLVLQPQKARDIAVKPEGERRWRWFEGWSVDSLELGWTLVSEKGVRYRIMSTTDWSQGGYYHYELTERPRKDCA